MIQPGVIGPAAPVRALRLSDQQRLDLTTAAHGGVISPAHASRSALNRRPARLLALAKSWTLREMRHPFVSLLSDDGMPVEDIARLVGHRGTAVTELVYRHQLRPVLEDGAMAMDRTWQCGAEHRAAYFEY